MCIAGSGEMEFRHPNVGCYHEMEARLWRDAGVRKFENGAEPMKKYGRWWRPPANEFKIGKGTLMMCSRR